MDNADGTEENQSINQTICRYHGYGRRHGLESLLALPKQASATCLREFRKKTRCSGEHPTCSICARLNQQCVYVNNAHITSRNQNDEPAVEYSRDNPQDSTPSRLNTIEARLEQISEVLGVNERQRRPPFRSGDRADTRQQDRVSLNLPSDKVNEGILLYYRYYCNCPLPLFDHLSSGPLSHQYPQVVLDAMLALSLRRAASSSAQSTDQRDQDLGTLARASWNSLTDIYRRFEFDLPFFQALCLLVQVDYAEGRTDRARTQVALGLKLAQTRGMLAAEHYMDMNAPGKRQHLEIIWSLFILDRMLIGGNGSGPTIPYSRFTLPAFSDGPDHPSQSFNVNNATNVRPSLQNYMIVGQYLQMMRIWELVAEYVNEGSIVDAMPIWHHQSPRSVILNHLLESEIPCEPHTYASVSPIDRVLREPHLQPYFRAWTYFQILHSTMHCCINHPFIIFLRARHHGSRVPLTFLQKAHKESLIYASWAAKTVSDMETAQLHVIDPFLAYLVGIAASIHIEHSLSSDISIASSAQQNLATCMAYLDRVSQFWPKVRGRVAALQDLQKRVGNRLALHFVEDEYDGAVPVRSMRHVSMSSTDERLMWMLFDSSNEGMLGTLHGVAIAAESGSSTANDAVEVDSMVQLHSNATAPSHETQTASASASASEQLPSMDALNVDWSLLGMPWPAYFPSDTGLLDDLSLS